ncbi:MAG: DUF3616 domain-containing protein [Rhodospirillales bacterium]|jgi:hypothetical protein|nr:DUF3616 domain-containing protein [Rhodospirillales bacterium]
MATPAQPLRRVSLDFRHDDPSAEAAVVREDLSACELTGSCLWLGCDETTTIQRLVRTAAGAFARHRSFALSEALALPAGPDEEIDIEGFAEDGGCLWVVGSHSLKRKKPKRRDSPAEALARLSEVSASPNRYLLARLPLVPAVDGLFDLGGLGGAADPQGRAPACLPMTGGRNELALALANDVHIGRFVDVPSKENGLDIEGIAVRGDRVFLGTRGPVLRGWAIILELSVVEAAAGELGLSPMGDHDEPYQKHFLDLDGLGIRDLAFDGNHLLILAGPTMDLDGPVRVYRWRDVLAADQGDIVAADDLERVLEVPFGQGFDHAEGMTLLEEQGAKHLLVVYDSPDPSRLHDNGTAIDAEIFAIAG